MTKFNWTRTFAVILLLLIGIALLIGGLQLLLGGAESWPDVVGSPAIVVNTAIVMCVLAQFFFAAITGLIKAQAWGFRFTLITLVLFVSGGFVGNYLLFDDIRLLHTGSNVVIAGTIVGLLHFSRNRENPTGNR